MKKKLKWYKIAESITQLRFNDNSLTEIKIHDKKICLIKTQNSIRACASRCPHAGGEMAEGFLDKNENITCPVHRYVFNLDNGRDLNNEGYYLKIYQVQITDTGIFLGMEDKGFFSWWK